MFQNQRSIHFRGDQFSRSPNFPHVLIFVVSGNFMDVLLIVIFGQKTRLSHYFLVFAPGLWKLKKGVVLCSFRNSSYEEHVLVVDKFKKD